MHILSGDTTQLFSLFFCLPFQRGSTPKRANSFLQEQRVLEECLHIRKINMKSQKFLPFAKNSKKKKKDGGVAIHSKEFMNLIFNFKWVLF